MSLDCQISPFHRLDGVNMSDNEWKKPNGRRWSYLIFVVFSINQILAKFSTHKKHKDWNKNYLPIFKKMYNLLAKIIFLIFSTIVGDAGSKYEVLR